MAKLSDSWLWQNLVSNLVWVPLAAIGGVAVGFLKAYESLLVAPVMYGLGAFFLILGSVAMLRLMSRLSRKSVTATTAKTAIRDWLDQSGLSVQTADDPEVRFRYIVTVNSRKISVTQFKGNQQYILFRALMTYDDDDRRVLSAIPGGLSEAIKKLRIHLAILKIGYAGIGMPLKEIALTRSLLITDDFNEQDFMRAIDEVEAAFILITQIISPPTGDPIPADTAPKQISQ